MTGLTGPSVLLLLVVVVVVTLCLSSAQDIETLEVLYPQRTITASRGSSVKLSCEANYEPKQCGWVHVAWGQRGVELTDPGKYITTVNETVSDDNRRCRQVVTEILNLTRSDAGQFQCEARCDMGAIAMGHFIEVNVKG